MAKAKTQHDDSQDADEKPAGKRAHLVPMFKDGATIDVHPSTVAAHEAVGWKRVG